MEPQDYRVLRTVQSYTEAQQIVDSLSDTGYPVKNLRIIGVDLETVETILGRQTIATSTWQGALSGAWFGLFIGLLFTIFVPTSGYAGIVVPILIGAVFGAVSGAVTKALQRGKRDFSSIQSMRANSYEVQVVANSYSEANAKLNELGFAVVTEY